MEDDISYTKLKKRARARISLELDEDHSLRPKRLDFEAALGNTSSSEEDRMEPASSETSSSCQLQLRLSDDDDVLDDIKDIEDNDEGEDAEMVVSTPPNRRPLPNIRLLTSSSASRSCRHKHKSRRVLLHERQQQARLNKKNNQELPCLVTSPVTAPKPKPHPRILLFSPSDANRRRSAPAMSSLVARTPLPGGRHRRRAGGWEEDMGRSLHKSRLISSSCPNSIKANINPFTPSPLIISANVKKAREEAKRLKEQQQVGMFTPTSSDRSFDQEDLKRTVEQFLRDQREAEKKAGTKNHIVSNAEHTPVTTVNNNRQSFLRNVSMNSSSSSPSVPPSPEILPDSPLNPAKRLRVSEMNIARYEEEFIELQEIATGLFGTVKIARHRLDGMVYAIKVARTRVNGNNQERACMNEVFAHAALMKHKHVVRYYNSWVENGHVYIQTEYCEGGSLAQEIKKRKEQGRRFSENELKRITVHLAKGLAYIHSKNLVHLDIKPENIFISLDHITSKNACSDNDDEEDEDHADVPMSISSSSSSEDEEVVDDDKNNSSSSNSPGADKDVAPSTSASPVPRTPKGSQKKVINDSTDSGNVSEGSKRVMETERISYKIGDLGHISPIEGDYIPEEGDCRYFAPELLLHEVDREKLPKADVFSMGLTLYECATLTDLPKNSEDDPVYERVRNGNVPYVSEYSKEFNQLIKLMTAPDPMSRPSANRILMHPFVKHLHKKTRSNLELYKELKATRQKLKQLESQLARTNNSVGNNINTPKRLGVGKGTKRSKSCYHI